MVRFSLRLAVVALSAFGAAGCTLCDTGDDFPVPCVAGGCVGGAPGGVVTTESSFSAPMVVAPGQVVAPAAPTDIPPPPPAPADAAVPPPAAPAAPAAATPAPAPAPNANAPLPLPTPTTPPAVPPVVPGVKPGSAMVTPPIPPAAETAPGAGS